MYQELVPPAVERVEALGVVDVVDEHAAVSPAIKGHAEGLEALLTSRIPELFQEANVDIVSMKAPSARDRVDWRWSSYLHRHLSVVDEYFPREEVGADGSLVTGAELLVYLQTVFWVSPGAELYAKHRALGENWSGDADAADATAQGVGSVTHTYWFIKLVLPTPLSPRMMT